MEGLVLYRKNIMHASHIPTNYRVFISTEDTMKIHNYV